MTPVMTSISPLAPLEILGLSSVLHDLSHNRHTEFQVTKQSHSGLQTSIPNLIFGLHLVFNVPLVFSRGFLDVHPIEVARS